MHNKVVASLSVEYMDESATKASHKVHKAAFACKYSFYYYIYQGVPTLFKEVFGLFCLLLLITYTEGKEE